MGKILRPQHNPNIWIGLLCSVSNANAVSKRKPLRAQKWKSDKRTFSRQTAVSFYKHLNSKQHCQILLTRISLITYSLKSWTRTWNRKGWREVETTYFYPLKLAEYWSYSCHCATFNVLLFVGKNSLYTKWSMVPFFIQFILAMIVAKNSILWLKMYSLVRIKA